MEKKYLAFLAAALLIGSMALVPAVTGEKMGQKDDYKIEIILSDQAPNLSLDLFGILGIVANFDFGNWFLNPTEMNLGVELFNVSVVLSIFGEEEELIVLVIPMAILTLFPLALEIVFEGFNTPIISIPSHSLCY